jgi:hypothetical protein
MILVLDNFYISFYFLELICRLYVYRAYFFTGPASKWNIFDLVLVIAGVYDFIQSFTPIKFGAGGLGVTWLRLLRLLKMTKMLRVVRVMRFFKVLRMMVMAIIGSMATLFWSILMMVIMLYMFGLCFIQAVAGYVAENHGHIPEEIYDGITTYYSSVPQAVVTLYMAVTGGADWEPLAAPVQATGIIFYSLFLFYIAFASFAVLNVLTGMFVDTAMKVSGQDDELVLVERAELPEVEAFRTFWREYYRPSSTDEGVGPDKLLIPGNTLAKFSIHGEPALLNFFSALDISAEEGLHIHERLETDGEDVTVEVFVQTCLQARNSSYQMDVIHNETKKLVKEFKIAMLYMEERFNTLAKKKPKKSNLEERWAKVVFRPPVHKILMREHVNQKLRGVFGVE